MDLARRQEPNHRIAESMRAITELQIQVRELKESSRRNELRIHENNRRDSFINRTIEQMTSTNDRIKNLVLLCLHAVLRLSSEDDTNAETAQIPARAKARPKGNAKSKAKSRAKSKGEGKAKSKGKCKDKGESKGKGKGKGQPYPYPDGRAGPYSPVAWPVNIVPPRPDLRRLQAVTREIVGIENADDESSSGP